MTIRSICKSITLVIVAFTSLTGCAELLDGPFNQGKYVVPPLLNGNNDSNFVSYWDEDSQSYRTYDQEENTLLATAIFDTEPTSDGSSQNFMVAGTAIVPLTKLDEDEMHIQSEQGCVACHET